MKKLLTVLLLLPILVFGKTITLNESNSINFNQDFNSEFVAKKQIEAMVKCAANVGSTINVVLYTPGGSISAGQLFFDTLNALPCKFNTITVTAASMGYQTVQNLGKRYIISSGMLMSHRAQISGLGGELGGDLDQVIKYLKNNVRELEEVAAKRIGLSLEKYRETIRDELWMTAKQAIESNHADEIVNVKCDNTLMSTHIETFHTFFGTFEVEFSDCPIVVAPLNIVSSNQTNFDYDFKTYYNNVMTRVKTTL